MGLLREIAACLHCRSAFVQLNSKHLHGCNDRLSKSLRESSSPREMNLFVQKRTGLNQLIHFSDIVGRNKYTFHKLPLSCFLARLSRKSNLILSRERERDMQALRFCQERRDESCIDTVGGRQYWPSLCGPTVALSGLNTTSCTVPVQSLLLRFSCHGSYFP